MTRRKLLSIAILVLFLFSACNPGLSTGSTSHQASPRAENQAGESLPEPRSGSVHSNQEVFKENSSAEPMSPPPTAIRETSAVDTPASTPVIEEINGDETSADNPTASQILGPDDFPPGISPLTGLPVEDSSRLALPPALISVTNFPISARPQAGLSYSPYVFELYIGEGMTRFLAMFYGDYPVPAEAAEGNTGVIAERNAVGPIRSGRLPYGSLSNLYNGFLVMASASSDVKSQLGGATTIFGSDSDDINSALIDVTQLDQIARAQSTNPANKKLNLTGNQFQAVIPPGGKDAPQAWIFYSWLNQVLWTYDPISGAYLRHQDNADGSGEFTLSTDRLNGEPLAYNNVIVLFAQHHVKNRAGTLIDVDLLYTSHYAYLLRDGRLYRLRWTTMNGEYEKTTGLLRPIRFVDDQGKPFPFKPGTTWIEIVDTTTTLQEVEPGKWKFRFYAPTR